MAALERRFVPQELDPADFEQLRPLYQSIVDREINSPRALEAWLVDASELTAVVDEFGTRLAIDYSCHTDDPELEKAYMHFVENVEPQIKPYFFRAKKKFLDCSHVSELTDPKYQVLRKHWEADVALFREENIPLETQIEKANKEYDKICGEMLIEFQGCQYTPQQMARFLEEPDRAVRAEAWEATETRRAQDDEPLNEIFDQLLDLRARIAANSGLNDYRQFMWRSLKRFDYTPQDCDQFADAIERACMPLVRQLNSRRRANLDVDRLRPWDLAVDPKNRPPLRPFEAERVDELVDRCQQAFQRLAPSLAEDFSQLKFGQNLDLDSRKGKRPGGYQASLPESKQPFIFMNAVGLHRDVETLLHEAGHAFHYLWSCDEPILFLQHAPMEFCEVASMSMELLADRHMDVFYRQDDATRAVQRHLEGIVRFFPWMATIDQFQHWLYRNEGHTQAQRTEAWLEIRGRFRDESVDYSGYERFAESMWQRQLHLFHVPFYYVEYGIAQLGALQLWNAAEEDLEKALTSYRTSLRLGGTRPLPELFEAAGLRFDFSYETIVPLMDRIGQELPAS